MVQVNTPILLRLKFFKVGRLQYISHLDLVRTMSKVVTRAGLPLWFTEGFNPKPKLVFSVPLSIGMESETEFLDIRLTRTIDPDAAMAALNRNLTEEMQMTAAYYPLSKLSELKWLTYEIRIRTVGASCELARACTETLLSDRVEVMKRAKDGTDTCVDIRPRIREAAVAYLGGDELLLTATLNADPSAFLNPEHLLTALKEKNGILSDPDLTREGVSILRKHAYREDMTDFS